MASARDVIGMSIDDLVAASGLGRTSIYDQIRRGRLVARKCGKRTIILPSDATAWLESLPRMGMESEP